MKLVNRYFLLALIFVLLWGCGNIGSNNKVRIQYSRWGEADEINSTRRLLDLFMKKNPDVEVVLNADPWGRYWDKLQTQFAADLGPDVFFIHAYYLADFQRRGALMKLDDLVKTATSLDLTDFYSPPFELYNRDGHLYGLPRDINSIVLYYNKDLFDKSGVAYPTPEWTWKDLLSAAKRLTLDSDNNGIKEQWGIFSWLNYEVMWGNFVLQNGGRLLDDTGRKCLAYEQPFVGAIKFLHDLEHLHKVSPGITERSSLGSGIDFFQTGKVAMVLDGSWKIETYNRGVRFAWNMQELPKAKQRACIANGVAHAINSKTKHADAAWRLVKFLSDREAQEALARSGTSLSVRKSVTESPMFLDGRPANKKVAVESIRYGRNFPVTPRLQQWLEGIIGQDLEAAFLDPKADIGNVLKKSSEKVDRFLAEEAKQ